MSEPLIVPGLVRLDADLGSDKESVIGRLAEVAAEAGRSPDASGLTEDAMARENQSATGLPGGIAIPHCRTAHVDVPTLVFARLDPPVDFGANDAPADLAFLIAAPAGGGDTHLQVLTKLARGMVKREFTASLRSASSPEEVVTLVSDVVGTVGPEAPKPAPAAPAASSPSSAGDPPEATRKRWWQR